MRVKTNAHTNRFRLCRSRTRRSLRSRRMWKKHVYATFVIMLPHGEWTVQQDSQVADAVWRMNGGLIKADCDVGVRQTISISTGAKPDRLGLGFSSKQRRVHQSWTADTQRSNMRQTSAASLGVVQVSSWLSSAKKEWQNFESVDWLAEVFRVHDE